MKKPQRQIIGRHACKEALKLHCHDIKQAHIVKEWENFPALKEIHNLLLSFKIPILYKSSQQIIKTSQGIVLFCDSYPLWNLQKLKEKRQAVIVAIDSLKDPQNLGSLLRSSWLLGADGILLCKHHSVSLTPTVHKIASGGAEHVPVKIVTNLSHELLKLKEVGFWIYGLEVAKEKALKPLWDESFPQKSVLLAGSEQKGLRKQIKKTCDQILTIPQVCKDHSLNVSISLAIALYELSRTAQKN